MSRLIYKNMLWNQQTVLKFTYTNWRNETAERLVHPKAIEFGTTPEHDGPCWMLRAFCQDRQADRNFVLSKMLNVEEVLQ